MRVKIGPVSYLYLYRICFWKVLSFVYYFPCIFCINFFNKIWKIINLEYLFLNHCRTWTHLVKPGLAAPVLSCRHHVKRIALLLAAPTSGLSLRFEYSTHPRRRACWSVSLSSLLLLMLQQSFCCCCWLCCCCCCCCRCPFESGVWALQFVWVTALVSTL